MKATKLLPVLGLALSASVAGQDEMLGLPEVPVPDDNPQMAEKVALGKRLFEDTRFSATGEVSCATCHDDQKAFTDSPLVNSEGINGLTGTRNAPTVFNAAYMDTQFWDGRSPDLEDQAQQPFVNPVEMGLDSHEPILEVIENDADYRRSFRNVFDMDAEDVTIEEVTEAIAAFERTLVGGNSPWDRWYFGGEEDAISESAKRGFDIFLNDGRCVSCHTIEQDHAVFTDHEFHNIGIGINNMSQERLNELAADFMQAKAEGANVDQTVLSDPDSSELGRFAVSEELTTMGAFKTPTLRNVELTAPYMHDGSLETLDEVMQHYNNGGVLNPDETTPTPHLSGGIKPLDLSDEEVDDVIAFMEALTSSEFAESSQQVAADGTDQAQLAASAEEVEQ